MTENEKTAQLDRLLEIEQRLFDALDHLAPGRYTRLNVGCLVYSYEMKWGLDDLAAYITWSEQNGCQDEINTTLVHDIMESSRNSACFEPRSMPRH